MYPLLARTEGISGRIYSAHKRMSQNVCGTQIDAAVLSYHESAITYTLPACLFYSAAPPHSWHTWR